MLYQIVIGYFIVINLISVVVCIWDKTEAKKGGWRVPEQSLFMLVFFGGGIGMYITMKTIRHKTQHKRFMIGVPLIIILQLAVVLFLCSKIL